ncbi:MAG: hypothetical protein CL483_14115 [Acidobacteria bacterium]|nr:hypothetical protein [Acidobacteriota bacterium]
MHGRQPRHHIRSPRRDLGQFYIKTGQAQLASDPSSDRTLSSTAGDKRRIHGVNGNEVSK